MRGTETFTESPFTPHRLEDFVPTYHPLRRYVRWFTRRRC